MNKDALVKWMKKYDHSNEWLAGKCGVKPKTVTSWRSDRPIPAKAIVIIQGLIDADDAAEAARLMTPQNLILEFGDNSFDSMEQAALAQGMTVRQWAKSILNAAANEDMDEFVDGLPDNVIDPIEDSELKANGSNGEHFTAHS